MTYETVSYNETVMAAKGFAKTLKGGELLLFKGELGSGKTAFCRGLSIGLQCSEEAASPTFAIVNEYFGTKHFVHFDMYRLSSEYDLEVSGFYDYLNGENIVAVEWSERFNELSQLEHILVEIKAISQNRRSITVTKK